MGSRGGSCGASFRLHASGYVNEVSTRSSDAVSGYDRVEYCIVDSEGSVQGDLRSKYDPSTGSITVEGLHEGEYKLLVLAVRGDLEADGARIRTITSSKDVWLSFPEELSRPLTAEYYYGSRPFSVRMGQAGESYIEQTVAGPDVSLRRIVTRLDFDFGYRNKYVRTATVSRHLTLEDPVFYSSFAADSTFSGRSTGHLSDFPIPEGAQLLFLPLTEGSLQGSLALESRSYEGDNVLQHYTFDNEAPAPNHIGTVHTDVVHPDDKSGMLFITHAAYAEGNHTKILQDGEHKSVYTNESQRMFKTTEPLQLSLDQGRLHARFYSPRPLTKVKIQARIASLSAEYVDLAWFDSIPAFADVYLPLPVLERDVLLRTESGRIVSVGKKSVESLGSATFRIDSPDPYWEKLKGIKTTFTISWNLYGGDPEKANGGTTSNGWQGIRPVHCRESVAFFLNLGYMVHLKGVEEVLEANKSSLGNNGWQELVPVSTVLSQIRASRRLKVGLINSSGGVLGRAGGTTYGIYQWGWFNHYTDKKACETFFHELGHIYGYNHNNGFTYGAFSQKIMNNFYVEHVGEFPVDSPKWLDSSNNPTKY